MIDFDNILIENVSLKIYEYSATATYGAMLSLKTRLTSTVDNSTHDVTENYIDGFIPQMIRGGHPAGEE